MTIQFLVSGVVKVAATAIFIFFGVETLGRKKALIISAFGMGTLFYIIGAILKTHPPPPSGQAPPTPPPASQAMAAMLYIYVCFYSMGWGTTFQLAYNLSLTVLISDRFRTSPLGLRR